MRTVADILRDVTDEFEVLVSEAGPCDHSVGICLCGYYRLIAEARAVLAPAPALELPPEATAWADLENENWRGNGRNCTE